MIIDALSKLVATRLRYNRAVFYPHILPVQAPDTPHFRIAVMRFSALGDLVLVAAAVRALQAQLPNAHITWITSPLGYSLLQGMSGVTFVVRDKPRSFKDYLSTLPNCDPNDPYRQQLGQVIP